MIQCRRRRKGRPGAVCPSSSTRMMGKSANFTRLPKAPRAQTRRREKHLSVRILALRGLEPLGQRLIRGMVAQEPPSHLKHHFEAIALQRGSADGRIAKISNWRVGSNGTIYNPPAICE